MARMRDTRGSSKVFVGRPEGKRLLERPRRRLEGSIQMDLKWDGAWAGLIWRRTRIGGGLL